MTPIRSVKNQYLGVNAHLHSFWQGEGGWNNFHNLHIGDLAGLLRQQLLPMGYTAVIEESLQVRRVGNGKPRQPRADIAIRDLDRERVVRPRPSSSSEAPVLTVEELVEEKDIEKPYRAVAIYERLQGSGRGEAVAWIELLSPTNKGESADANSYLGKRWLLLENRLVFVELDFLHETPPTFSRLPDYTRNEPDSHPYRIVVLDPRPDMKTGPADPKEFDVDEETPTVAIPLTAGNSLEFSFGEAYNKTFEEMAYGLELVDYTEISMNFDRYNRADQTRIAARMLAVLEAARDGVDLETGPFPVKDIELEAALEQIEALKKSFAES